MPSLGFSGFDGAAEDRARAAFSRIHATGWSIAAGEDADAVLLDLDSMSGQMAWMKGFAEGVVVIGVTAASRARTPFHLPDDFTSEALGALLAALGGVAGQAPPLAQATAPPPGSVTAEAARPPTLARRIAAATTPFAVHIEGLPRLVVDPQRGQFAPGKSLKALLGYGLAVLPDAAVTVLEPDAAEATLFLAGDPQPLARLSWLLALGGGAGRVLGHPADARFQLGKWPQVEREFPKHFRIATVMLKAPATVAEIALASGASEAEVADYVNAALVAGHASAH